MCNSYELGYGEADVKLKDCGDLRDRNSLHAIDMNNPAPGHERGDPEFLMIRPVLSARLLELSQFVSVILCGSERIPRILRKHEDRKTLLIDRP